MPPVPGHPKPLARSDVARLKREAIGLTEAVRAGDHEARSRIEAHLALKEPFPHTDALHVLALENGHASWSALTLGAEIASMDRDGRRAWLERAVYFGHAHVVERLLEVESDVPGDDLGLRIALFDAAFVRRALVENPAAATSLAGRRMPIAHLCFSQYARLNPEERAMREQASLEVAELLVEHGANVNESVAAEPGSPHRLSMLYGALGHAGNLALARWLLEHGANPNDDESLYHATEREGAEAVRLLLRHGARIEGTNAILRAVHVGNVEALRVLVAAGGDPNAVVSDHPSGEPIDAMTPLQLAAMVDTPRDVVEVLLDGGADPELLWNGRSAYGTARIHGSRGVADLLEARGHGIRASGVDEVLASCAEGVAPASRLNVTDLSVEDRRLLIRVAGRPGRGAHLRALLAAGLSPGETDEMGMTALHMALWEGIAANVAVLLEQAPDFGHVNAYGGDAVHTLLHGAEFCPAAGGREHVACAALLVEAGAPLPDDRSLAECGHPDVVAFYEGVRASTA